ncbi:MAG: UDP-2,3-diacylglucosamine diphosphatase [Bacteroidota bacterium]
MKKKRKLDICILSDLHLGTYGCHAIELLQYLTSVKPELLILNGDIIDIWNFRKKYFPATHMKVIRHFIKLIEKGVKVVYITGNHDDTLRKYSDCGIGNFLLTDKYIFERDGKSHWAFHGDVFDHMTKGRARFIAKLGGKGYDLLILFNRWLNKLLVALGMERMSLSKKVKDSVKGAIKFISNFEKIATNLAIDQKFDYVICGHIHQPKIKTISNEEGTTVYLNSGDWVENLTALEYVDGEWSIYRHDIKKYQTTELNFNQVELSEFSLKNELENILNLLNENPLRHTSDGKRAHQQSRSTHSLSPKIWSSRYDSQWKQCYFKSRVSCNLHQPRVKPLL